MAMKVTPHCSDLQNLTTRCSFISYPKHLFRGGLNTLQKWLAYSKTWQQSGFVFVFGEECAKDIIVHVRQLYIVDDMIWLIKETSQEIDGNKEPFVKVHLNVENRKYR